MQRRDVGNEVIVALAAIGMLALALTFGVVLTLSRTVSNPTQTGTAVAGGGTGVATLPATTSGTTAATSPATAQATTQVATTPASGTAQATTQAAPLVSGTADVSAVATQSATLGATSKGTEVAVAASVTASRTSTATSTKTTTPTNTQTATATRTPTITSTSTQTSTPTTTPSNTTTNTATPIPTETFTQTPSDTPTATATPTQTSTPTLTKTLLPTFPLPGAPTAQIVVTVCMPRAGWVAYTVREGDTLFSISRQAGVSLADMQQANCITNPNTIYVGEVIVVPPGTFIGSVTPVGTAGTVNNGNASLCPNPNARITSPISGSSVSGVVTLYGSANIPNFDYYFIEYKPDINAGWSSFGKNFAAVNNGLLGRFDPNPSQLPLGGYSLRLNVVDGAFTTTTCTIRITLTR